jgi:hypothetical protein
MTLRFLRSGLFLLLVIISVLNIITQPKLLYPGDNFVPRAEAANLINNGQMGFNYADQAVLRDLLDQRGQYFFENDSRQRLSSKYGVANTYAYIIPLLVEKTIHGELPVICTTSSLMRILNIYHLLLVLGATIYLYAIVGFFTEARIVAASNQAFQSETFLETLLVPLKNSYISILFVVITFYSSYAWYYLRAPTLEVYQFLPFFGYIYHALRAFRLYHHERSVCFAADNKRSSWKCSCMHWSMSILYIGILILLKPLYLILLMPTWLFSLVGVLNSRRQMDIAITKRVALSVLLPTILVVSLLLIANTLRYGSPFETGYGQWLNSDGTVNTRISPALFLHGFKGLFLTPINGWNVFIYAPMFFFSIFGIPRFLNRHGAAAGFVLMVTAILLVAICCIAAWSGAMAYGPRYTLFAVLIGSLPILEVWRLVYSKAGSYFAKGAKVVVSTLMITTLGVSFLMQLVVISVPYLGPDYVESVFMNQTASPAIEGYFHSGYKQAHKGFFYADLLKYRQEMKEYTPLLILRESGWAEDNPDAFVQLEDLVGRMSVSNLGLRE